MPTFMLQSHDFECLFPQYSILIAIAKNVVFKFAVAGTSFNLIGIYSCTLGTIS